MRVLTSRMPEHSNQFFKYDESVLPWQGVTTERRVLRSGQPHVTLCGDCISLDIVGADAKTGTKEARASGGQAWG